MNSADTINKFERVDCNFTISSKELCKAIQRVGATAQDAKVSFEKLIRLISDNQEMLDGRKIGNLIKKFLTIIQRNI